MFNINKLDFNINRFQQKIPQPLMSNIMMTPFMPSCDLLKAQDFQWCWSYHSNQHTDNYGGDEETLQKPIQLLQKMVIQLTSCQRDWFCSHRKNSVHDDIFHHDSRSQFFHIRKSGQRRIIICLKCGQIFCNYMQ